MRGWLTGLGVSVLAASTLVVLPTASDIPATAAASRAAATPVMVPSTAVYPASLEGKKCAKRGATRIVGADTYRCVAQGKRLVWKRVTPPTPSVKDGDACTTAGHRVSNPPGYLECRVTAGNRLVYRQLSLQPKSPGITASPQPIDTCRLSDTRPNRGLPPGPGGTLISEAIAYPVTSATRPLVLPASGKARVAVLPYDFSDAPGDADPQAWLKPQMDRVSDWIEHYSAGRVEYEWVTSNTWIRASKPSSEYQFLHPRRGGVMPPDLPQGPFKTEQWIAQDLLTSAPDNLDLGGVRAVFFVYPQDVHYPYDLPVREVTVNHPDFPRSFLMFSSGRWLYEQKMPLWSFIVHEFGHFQGIPGHAPWDGSPLDVMTNQHGLAITLGTWSRLTMDWQDTREVYCTTREALADDVVTLSALDSEEAGTKAVIVRLNESRALIMESRRRSTWSSGAMGWPGLPEGFYGLTVIRVDTSVDLNRVQQAGAYLDFIDGGERGHGVLFQQGLRVPPFDLDNVIYEGESIVTDGVRISLTRSGDHDRVHVSRA